MKVHIFLFCLLVAMCVVSAITCMISEKPNSHGVVHPKYANKTLHQGGPGAERHDHLRWLGWAFGSAQIVFMVSCLVLGLRQSARRVWPLVLSSGLFLALLAWIFVADAAYVRDNSPKLFFSFPAPTAILLYGLSTVPVLFMLIYVVTFDRWVLAPDDLERFHELVRKRQEQRKGH